MVDTQTHTMKKVTITLDKEVHYQIKILYAQERTNLSNQVNEFLKSELRKRGKENGNGKSQDISQ